MKNQKNPLSRKEDIVVQELDGEVLIYDLKDNKAFCLNETSALVWQMCDGENSISEISKGLSKKLNSPANEDLVWLALDQLKKEKLIENEVETPASFAGMNRRDVIKKVGLASMIALPVVAGLVAPTAANAASVCVKNVCQPPGSVCAGCNGQTVTGFTYASSNGSCTGAATARTVVCNGQAATVTNDFIRN